MHFRLAVCLLIATMYLVCPGPTSAAAQTPTPLPVDVQLAVDRVSLGLGESTEAILSLRNTQPYTITNVGTQFIGTNFGVTALADLPDLIPPYSSVQTRYTLQSQVRGLHNIVFAVRYSWNDPIAGTVYRRIETLSAEKIEVTTPATFKWPDYLIPLAIGFLASQFGTWIIDWRKQRKEEDEKVKQANGMTSAILESALQSLALHSKVNFGIWEDTLIKGGFYPALCELGRRVGDSDLPKRLTKLSIMLKDYNDRQETGNLADDIITRLTDELTDLVKTLDNRGPAKGFLHYGK